MSDPLKPVLQLAGGQDMDVLANHRVVGHPDRFRPIGLAALMAALGLGGGGGLFTQCVAKLALTANQSIPDNSDTIISFQSDSANSPRYDDDGGFDFAGHPDRWTVPTGKGGTFMVSFEILWGSNSQVGIRGGYVELIDGSDGVTSKGLIQVNLPPVAIAGNGTCIGHSGPMKAADGDFFVFHATLGSAGAPVNATASANRTYLALTRVGD